MTKKSTEQLRRLGRFVLGEVIIIPSFNTFIVDIDDESAIDENEENISANEAESLLANITAME